MFRHDPEVSATRQEPLGALASWKASAPYRVAREIRWRLRSAAAAVRFAGNARSCPICDRSVRTFLPAGLDRRPDARCPVCHSLERHRFLWTVLTRKRDAGGLRWQGRLLHVAPERVLERALRGPFGYVSLYIQPGRAMVTGDLTSLRFPDGSFDAVVCNHVLEHIRDDRSALAEISRVLRPGGWASLQVPIVGAATQESPRHATTEELRRLHGQEDHVRSYGTDIRDRIAAAGLRVEWHEAKDVLEAHAAERMGIPLGEICILGVKDRDAR